MKYGELEAAGSNGEATITAQVLGTEHKTTCNVKIVRALDSITINDETIEIGQSKLARITKSPNDVETEDLEYISSSEEIAKIDNIGNIKGISEGETKITVKGKKTGKYAECTITVTKPVEPQVGDFVNYSLPNWTSDEVNYITDLNTKIGSYRFSVPTVDTSKDENGWRILNIDENGIVTIISNTLIEDFYVPKYSMSGNTAVNILSNGEEYISYNNGYETRKWDMYVDSNYATKARLVKYIDVEKFSQSDTMRKLIYHYWLCQTNGSSGVSHIDRVGRLNWYDGYNQTFKIRTVVTLLPEIKLKTKGDSTHITIDSAWQLEK